MRLNMLTFDGELSLNPYFFGKCSTAVIIEDDLFAEDNRS